MARSLQTPFEAKRRLFTRRALACAATLLVACNSGAPDDPAAPAGAAPPAQSVELSDEESIGPFSSWANVKTQYGAVGDGIADDTLAIQSGLDALRKYDSSTGPAVLYFPAGTYRITATLGMELNAGANLIGADPSTTTIVWDGAAGGTMLTTSGSFDTLFARLGWNGAGSAAIGVAQWWNYSADSANYQGSIKHVDEVFENLGIGIYGGRLGADYGQGDSETLIERVTFRNDSVAGINLGSYNALNWWIWDSAFIGCARGVTNDFSVNDSGATQGAGNFMVYRSQFLGSTIADISVGNTQWFSLHDNYSKGSQQFIQAGQNDASNPFIVQNNTVLDTVDPVSIRIGDEGPLLLVDNRIRSLPGATGPVVQLYGTGASADQSNRDALAIGNQFTVADPVAVTQPGGRLISAGNSVFARSAIVADPPLLPAAARNFVRRVFEVPSGATAAQIQSAIDAAAGSGADNAVVHLPAGLYLIDHTITVPALARLQIAGDSEATLLNWTGASASGPLFSLVGPSYATLRDIALQGAPVTAIRMAGADQGGGRIFIEGSRLSALDATGLASTRVDAHANTQIGALSASGAAAVTSIGCGGLGPVKVEGASNVLVADSWYQGPRSALLGGKSGSFTYLGGLMAPYSSGVEPGLSPSAPAVLLDAYSGSFSLVGASLALGDPDNGVVVRSLQSGSRALFLGVSSNLAGFFSSAASPANVGAALQKLNASTGAIDLPDWGADNTPFILDGLSQARALAWKATPFVHTPGATDVRLFRVLAENTAVALSISP